MKKSRTRWIILGMIVSIYSLQAQQDSTQNFNTNDIKHSLFIELLGNGIIGSLNYDLRWKFLSLRVGYSPLIMINGLLELGDNRIELGFGNGNFSGKTIDFGGGSGSPIKFFYWTSTIAFLWYQPPDKKVFFKFSFTPYLKPVQNDNTPRIPLPQLNWWGGFAVGYTF